MSAPTHTVVISGIGGKFPETDNVLQLQEKLFAKEDFITNEMRWTPDTIGVGKMHNVDSFDTSPFKMHSKLVRATDPTTTQTLERAFEAIIDAGMNPFAMSGRNIAVISASMVSDSENTRAGTSYEASGFTIMGHNRSMVSNRISYTFNFTGPSFSIHTSWAGGARALQQGAEMIAQGFVDAAIVSTASLIFFKATALEYEDMEMATPGGRCRSFDADANGTCRSEGVVSFFLQRASDAKRNYATVVSAHAECLGPRACSLIHFDKLLRETLKEFYKKNNINPNDIAYLEADGCGVKCFDKLELDALSSVFEERKRPLPIGSVKSNVGNTEASSSFIGITKSIIAMETGLIPPNIHFTRPNPDIPSLVNGQFQPVTEAQQLEGDLISVNTLSLGGTSGHVIIRRNNKEKNVLAKGQLPPDGLHRLIMVSCRHEEGAKAIAEKLQNMPVDAEYASLVNDVFKSNIPGYLWKSFVVVPSTEVKYNIKKFDNEKQPLWYVFSGMGSQWSGMGRDLLQIPVFAAAVDKCDAVLRPRGLDIYHILTTTDSSVFENILNCFVGIAAIQIGLVDILRTIGLEPDGMVGHSVGELGCAYADGCFTAEEMVLAAYARGKASLECDVIHGMMAAIGLGNKEMQNRIPPSIDVACHNAHDSCTLSGPTEDVLNYVKNLKEEGIFAKAVSAGNIAYHSRYIKPIAPKLLEYLSELIKEPKPRSPKWVSSSVPESEWSSKDAQLSSAEYHTNNLLSPVLFEEACKHLPQNAVVVEIAPHGLLQAILRRSLSSGCINVPLTNRSASNGIKQLLEALGTLYLNNVSLEVNALYPPVEYPVSRGTPYIAPLVTWDHHETWFNEFESILQLMSHSNEEEVQMDESFEDYPLWTHHCIDEQIVLPAAQILVYIWNMQLTSNALEFEKDAILIEDMIMSRQVFLQPFSQQLVMTLRTGTNDFGVLLKEKDVYGETFLTGRVKNIQRPTLDIAKDKDEEDDEAMDISGVEVLDVLSQFGYQLGPKFHAIQNICIKSKGFTAEVEWTGNMVTFIDALFKLILFLEMESEHKFLYPSSFRTLTVDSATFFQLKEGTTVNVHYDSRSNILSCKGLLLVGLTMSSDPPFITKVPPLQCKKTTFVPFNCEKLKLEEFLSVSLQLVVEDKLNSWKNKTSQATILFIRDNNGTKTLLRRPLKNTLKSLPNISVKIKEMELSQAKDQIRFKPGEDNLIIGKLSDLQQLASCIEDSVYFLAHDYGSQASINSVCSLKSVLVHHLKGGDCLRLLKERTSVEQLRSFELDTEDWLSELGHLFNGSDNGQPVVVVSRKWGPQEILPTLANQKYSHRLRCIFLDKSAPRFSLKSTIYRDQLSTGLSVNKLSKGVWGAICMLNLDLDPAYHTEHLQGIITSSHADLDVNVLAINTTTVTFRPRNPPDQLRIQFVDYCGTKGSGERVMGLAHFNLFTNALTPDQILNWSVPKTWSMEEAATVTSSFSLAYYALYVKCKLLPGERVLIHIGLCPISQAFIAVALQAGADVYVTIKTKDELPSLLRTFPQLNGENVVPLEHFSTAVKLRTKGAGVEVVVNCLQDYDTTKSISCLSQDSRFIQLSNIDPRLRETVGMGVFIKNSNFFGVSLTNILNADMETKNKLQNYLRDGIKKGTVKPLRKHSFRLQDFSQAIDHLKTHVCEEKTLVVIKAEGRSELPLASLVGFHCEADKTYIIVGAGDLWLELAEWLVQRGARRLFVAPENDLSSTFSRRFHRLTSLCYIRVMMTSASRLVSHSGAVEFLHDAETLGSIAAVFCVTMEENCPKIAYLDSATRELIPNLKHFVCVLGGCTNVCKYRALSDLSVCLIRPQSVSKLKKPHSLLPYLSYILCNSSPTGYLFTVSDQEVKVARDDDELMEQDPRGLLPSSLQELLILADSVKTEPTLFEVVTRSLRHENVKHNLLPVFLLPGTHAANIQPLLHHMIHPAYCVSWSDSNQTVESTANALLKEVLRIQKEGPFNIVGESWSGAVALQLAALLEGCGHRVELFLLDAAPLTIQNCARALSCNFNDSMDLALLISLLNLDIQLAKHLTESSSWETLLDQALHLAQPRLQQVESTEEVRKEMQSIQHRVGKALTALRNHLKALMSYKPQENFFKGNVHLIRPKGASDIDFCGLQHLCQQRPTVYVMEEEESHEQMVKSHNCATIINKNLLYSWDL